MAIMKEEGKSDFFFAVLLKKLSLSGCSFRSRKYSFALLPSRDIADH